MGLTQVRSGQLLDDTIVDADINTAANIGSSKITSTLSGKTLTSAILGNDLDAGGFKISNLSAPVGANDVATRGYVDAFAQGLDIKEAVRAATTVDITLSAPQTIDDVAVIAGDRVLVKAQTLGEENGIYVVAAGAWTRASDADASSEVTAGMFTFVTEGTTNADSGWTLTTDSPIVLGTTALTFVQFSGAGQITAGAGLTKSGNTLDVGAGTGISALADSVAIDQTFSPTWSGLHTFTHASGLRIENALPFVEFRETDEVLPLGRWRIWQQSTSISFVKNTGVAGDFSSNLQQFTLTVNPATIPFSFFNSNVEVDGLAGYPSAFAIFRDSTQQADLHIESVAPTVELRETGQSISGGGLWRMRLDGTTIEVRRNTAGDGDFSSSDLVAAISASAGTTFYGKTVLRSGVSGSPQLRFAELTSVGSADTHALYNNDNEIPSRLHFKDSSGNDHTPAYIVDKYNHRIESTDPAFELRETDRTIDVDGLWRAASTDGSFKIQNNTAAAGDFSSLFTMVELFPSAANGSVRVHSQLVVSGTNPHLSMPGTAVVGSVASDAIFLSSLDTRFHIKDDGGVDRTIAYLDEIVSPGNTVLVSEYVVNETPTGAVNGANTTFTLANTPETGTVQVYQNGLLQSPTDDYTIVTDTITMNDAPATGDKIRVAYVKA